MRALVNRLLGQSFVDGPGNRAVIFLQGCQMRCLYCHNPQTQQLCNGCGACVAGCPGEALAPAGAGEPLAWNPERCQGCDRCITICPNRADPRARWYSVAELMAWLLPLRRFVSGVTLSGGEALLQPEFAATFLRQVREAGLTTMIETNGDVAFDAFKPLLPWLDGVLIDLKVWADDAHRALTGAPNQRVKENIRRLAGLGKVAEVRLPVIPGFSDTAGHVAAAAAFVAELDPAIPVRLLRFRPHGTRGISATWAPPPDALVDQLVAVARAAGLTHLSRSR